MLLKGFRPADGYQHKTVVEFMGKYLSKEYKNMVERFDSMRRKRNIFTYESDILISGTEAEDAIKRAVEFVQLIIRLLHKEHPQMELDFDLDKP
jgi:uncharacterized protein (UPF0332 family)